MFANGLQYVHLIWRCCFTVCEFQQMSSDCTNTFVKLCNFHFV